MMSSVISVLTIQPTSSLSINVCCCSEDYFIMDVLYHCLLMRAKRHLYLNINT